MQKTVLDGTTYEIPIEDFETDMNTESSKDKKESILDLFKNHNELKSEKEYIDIRTQLRYACEEGDLELIKILLSETIKDDSKNFLIKIDKTNKTASFYGFNKKSQDLIIPRTVKHENNDYLVTSICGLHGSIFRESLNIKFEEESAVSTIYRYAFLSSNIKEIYFPKSLIELKEGWCSGTEKLTRIIISPSNGQFIFKEDKYLIGKSNENNEEFDELLFVRRDIKVFSIPQNIKIIGSCSFSSSKIEEISIPQSVTKICEFAFSDCCNLRKIEIPTNSNLQTIEKYAFLYTKIEEIYFPESLIELKEGWCGDIKKLKRIIISPSNGQFIFKEDKYLIGKSNENNEEFDELLFALRDIKEFSIPQNIKIIGSCSFERSNIEEISIPQSVTKICEFAFSDCCNLRKIEIPTNSNLQTIEKYAFSYTDIEEIFIPQSVTKICELAFSDCYNLRKIEIPTNSNLQTIEKDAFLHTEIEEIYFPESLIELKEGWCSGTEKLTRIMISPSNGQFIFKEDKYLIGKSNENNEEFDKLLFALRDIKEISIPQNIKIIGSCSFQCSKIEEIFIPQSVTKICERAFSSCRNLIKVEIPTNSNLQTIEKNAFSNSKIEEIFIPQSVTKICEDAFSDCSELQIIEISEESQLQSISISSFKYCQEHMIIMIPSSLKKLIKIIDY